MPTHSRSATGFTLATVSVALAIAAPLACDSTPTSVLLRVEAEAALATPDALMLSAYAGYRMVNSRRVPGSGRPKLPGDLVIYPKDTTRLRLHVWALVKDKTIGEGVTTVQPKAGAQVGAKVLLRARRLPDGDGDGVPDAIDNCPTKANADQRPCTADSGVDGPRNDGPRIDGPRIDGPRIDGPTEDTIKPPCPDRDHDGYRDQRCGGKDCDDSRKTVHPGAAEGPPGAASCADKLDNDCDGAADLLDTGCRACTIAADCDDNNKCTVNRCTSGVCSNPPGNDGVLCDDGDVCTTATVCKLGKCQGGMITRCAATAACKVATCDPILGCVEKNAIDGTNCDDGKYCTTGTRCASGVCSGGNARNCAAAAPPCWKATGCDEINDRCVYVSVQDGVTCDDKDACTQTERCVAGVCTASPRTTTIATGNFDHTKVSDHALVLDSKGGAHVVYVSKTTKALSYATNQSGSWASSVVLGGAGKIIWPAIAIDTQDRLLIAFVDETTGAIRIARRASGIAPWTFSTVAAVGFDLSMVWARSEAHLAYVSGSKLYYVHGNPPSWSAPALVSATTELPREPSIAIDSAGRPHIAYRNKTTSLSVPDPLVYAFRATMNTWTSNNPAGTNETARRPSLALSGNSTFITDSSYRLTYRKSTSWQTITRVYDGRATIVLDSRLGAHVAHGGTSIYSYFDGKTWKTAVPTTNRIEASWIAREKTGKVHLVYIDKTASALKHTTLSSCP